MLEISLLLIKNDVENKDRYDSLALRFFQRFLEISDSMNGETGRTLFFTYDLQQTTISNFAAFSKITNKA